MERTRHAFLVFLLLLFSFSVLPLAAAVPAAVVDDAGLLTSSEAAQLEEDARSFAEATGCGFYIMILGDGSSARSVSISRAADALYDANGWGWGGEDSGVFLLVSLSDRSYAYVLRGDAEKLAGGRMEPVADSFAASFRESGAYEGFRTWLVQAKDAYEAAGKGDGDVANFVTLVAAFLIAVIGTMAARRRLHSVAYAKQADAYIPEKGCTITDREDRYVRSTFIRIPRPKSSQGGGRYAGGSGRF